MPTSVGPNTFGEENLVFGYDLGDVVNSYKGEPTTNVIANPEPLSGWGVSNYLTSTATITYSSDNGIPHLELSNVNVDSGYPRINMANLTSTITDGFSMSFEAKSNIAGTQVGLSLYSNGSTKTTQYTTLTTQWQRFKFENLSTGFTLDDGYLRVPSTTSGAVYYIRRIQVEQKTHATPFTTGTRSATQGLKDLTGNSTIDLTNVSFDSNAQMTFDGTNDTASTTTDITLGSNFSMEAVVYRDTSATGDIISSWNNPFRFLWRITSGNVQEFAWNSGGGSNTVTGTGTVPTGVYRHVIVTYDGINVKFYTNGALTDTFAKSFSLSNITAMQVGSNTYDSVYFDGRIPFSKIYNRALTASEVKSNFNAVKSRFGI